MKKYHILIVDDDREALALMREQLKALFEISSAESGEDCLSLLEKKGLKPDLVLLDITLPGISGYDVLKRMKENDTLGSVPVVFLTGMTDPHSEIRGLNTGAVDYLKKPVSGQVLLARVQRYIDLYPVSEKKERLDSAMLAALPEPLTGREMDVARLMGEFRSDREISEILYISMPYTKKLVAAVKAKLGIGKRGEIRKYLR